ncbi:MAG: DUF2723 domain-containing protein [Actinobacteria bacterium]|nr:DUF2723 domain-containing protein [Actinomycetota bacterium]
MRIRKLKDFYFKNKLLIFGIAPVLIPLAFYLITLERKLVGGDTSWYANELPQMMLLPPTGYPVFSLIGKLFSIIPIGPLALRLNLISSVFGSLTILFLFLAINKIIKNEFLSLISSLSFAFVFPYWFVANRLEFDTLNSFFIAFLLFAILKYQENPVRKNLYLCFFSLGLLTTNHPIAFFLIPAFLILIIIIKPAIFKNLKAILLSIIFFILPSLTYSYIYIRSVQGYGKAGTLIKFIYFITGREESGATFGGSFGNKNFSGILKVMLDYLKLVRNFYGIFLIIIAVIGLVYLFKKNWKFALFTFIAIIINLIITTQYLDWAVQNYTLNILLIMSVYIGCGFLLIADMVKLIFEKLSKNNTKIKTINSAKYILITFLFLIFASQPVILIINNFEKCNFRKPKGIYVFWDNAYRSMDKNAKLYAYSASINIAVFIQKFEQKDKNIRLVGNSEAEYNFDKIAEQVKKGIPVYFVGNDDAINQIFVTEKVGKSFYWDRYDENLQLYKITKAAPKVEIISNINSNDLKFGKEIIIEYKIKNNGNEILKINSIELKLPEGLKFSGVLQDGYIKQDPGISRGMYMWVSDYIVPSESDINLIFKVTAAKIGIFNIKLKMTTGGIYFNAKDLSFQVN